MSNQKKLCEMPLEAKEQALAEFKADILRTILRIDRFKNINDVDIESHYNYNKVFVLKRGIDFYEIHQSLYYGGHTLYCVQDILPLLISSPILRKLDYMYDEADLALTYYYICHKNDKYDEAIRYIWRILI